jgi:hypothetical protein
MAHNRIKKMGTDCVVVYNVVSKWRSSKTLIYNAYILLFHIVVDKGI